MRSPEEVAREALDCTEVHPDCPTWLHMTGFHTPPMPCAECRALHAAEVIRVRDAEVADMQRQVTLVGWAWETTPGPIGAHRGPARRLVGPWQPDPRTPEERSADAITDLKRRLGGTP